MIRRGAFTVTTGGQSIVITADAQATRQQARSSALAKAPRYTRDTGRTERRPAVRRN